MNTQSQIPTRGITLIELAIVFAVFAVVGLPSFETVLSFAVVAVVGVVTVTVAVLVLFLVRVLSYALRRKL